MVFAVDVGNTDIVIGCFETAGNICFTERISTDRGATDFEYAVIFRNVLEMHDISVGSVEGAIVSSVVPSVTKVMKSAVKKIMGVEAMIVGPGIKTGLSIKIDNPAQLGSDLVVGAVGGLKEYGAPLIVIDMGTATAVSVIDGNGSYIGGMLLPGVMISSAALTGNTSQLPNIAIEAPKKTIGTNTIDCIKSGIVYGTASCIDGIIDRISEEAGCSPGIIATGDLADTIIPFCRHDIKVDNDLMLKGLMTIYNKNK